MYHNMDVIVPGQKGIGRIGIEDRGILKDIVYLIRTKNLNSILCMFMEGLEPRARYTTVARCAVAGDLVPLTATSAAYISGRPRFLAKYKLTQTLRLRRALGMGLLRFCVCECFCLCVCIVCMRSNAACSLTELTESPPKHTHTHTADGIV